MYTLRWNNITLKPAEIAVPIGSIVSDKASIKFTGKGAANYGVIQQENLMRILECFAGPNPPQFPTVGQEWFDSANNALKVCTSVSPTVIWKSLGGIQVSNPGDDTAPSPAAVGDVWFQRTGTSSGFMYIYTGLGRYPISSTGVGGWSQLWPQVETIAGREEYDYVAGLVKELLGPANAGGSGALGKALPSLIDLTVLDADRRAKFAARGADPTVLQPAGADTSELLTDVVAWDWDMLLAAARFAVNRLDLPAGMLDDISPMPFVSDGRQAHALLTALPGTDVRYPSLERRSNRRFGIVTLVRAFTETVNVLKNAVANKYSLKGINGSTGTNPAFAPSTEVVAHHVFSGPATGAASGSLRVNFNFTSQEALQSFLYSGGAIQITLNHVPGGSATTADTNFKALTDQRGVIRITADKIRTFSNVFPPVMVVQPRGVGLKDGGTAGLVLATQTVSGASYTISSSLPSSTMFSVAIDFASTGPMNGGMTMNFEIIRDNSSYQLQNGTSGQVYGSPLPYATADKAGGSAFLN